MSDDLSKSLQQKIDLKTKPIGSLGILEEIAFKVGTIQNTTTPKISKPTIVVFAGDHGIANEGVSPFPQEVTAQMVLNFVQGGAAINVFCKENNLDLKVVDMGVAFEFDSTLPIDHSKVKRGTENFLNQSAMTIEEMDKAIQKGRDIVSHLSYEGCNTVGFGEMGIANTTSSSCIMLSLTDFNVDDCVGIGTGLNDEGLDHKKNTIKKALEKFSSDDPLEVLQYFGGFEIAGIVGAFQEAHKQGMLVLIDGFITCCALLVASKIKPKILDNCIFSHKSQERGHKYLLEHFNAKPLLDFQMRLGEGSGAAVAFPLVRSAVSFLNNMASFEDAGVSNKE